ncbi:MAG: hypothetical protein HUU38_08970 [Anaerolineales bacterium]|nr:hypothetical protein [Anaerolineales bacterium]
MLKTSQTHPPTCPVCHALRNAIPPGENGLTAWEAHAVFTRLGLDPAGPAESHRWLLAHGWTENRPHTRLDRDLSFAPPPQEA